MNILSKYVKIETFDTLTTAGSSVDLKTVDDFTNIAEKEVPNNQLIAFGGGRIVGGVDDRRTFTADLNTSSPSDIDAAIRLTVADPNKQQFDFVDEYNSTEYEAGVRIGEGGGTGNRSKKQAKPENHFVLVQAATLTGTATVSYSDSSLTIPLTVMTVTA